jgi:surfeit locus 1 family protein
MMRFGSYRFSPALWPSIATLVLLPVLTGLGYWQLDRAAWKQGLVDKHAVSSQQASVPLESIQDINRRVEYRAVTAAGHYDLEHQLLLDNRTHQGHAGYHVLTPLLLRDQESVVLVNRGWVPAGLSRALRPDLPGPANEVIVEALVKLPPEKSFRLDTVEETHAGWPKVVQQIKLAPLEQRLGYPLLPLILLLDKKDVHGFVREWKPVYGVTPDKHRAYAMQWFTLAVVLLLIYIGVNTRRISNEATRDGNETE